MLDISPETKALIASYLRSLIAAGVAAYTATGGNTTATLNAIWAAVIPTAMRYLNPNDHAFGRKKY